MTTQTVTIGRTTYTVTTEDAGDGMILGTIYTPAGKWRGWVCEDPATGNRHVMPPMSAPVGAERAALAQLTF